MLELLSSCQLCPHRCKVNRLKGEKGFCRSGARAKVYSYHLHFGEEPPISGASGSGTIFFSNCNSKCVYCQNYKFSQKDSGVEIEIKDLAGIMLGLQEKGAHNINLVTPQHFIPHIIEAINIAKKKGLNIPIVYNTNGYDLPETIELLEGFIDIYLPDMRYSSNDMAMKYSLISDYVDYNRKAVKRMYEQVGDIIIEDGIAKRGLIIRHLVLPNNIAGTQETMRFIANKLSKNIPISLMSQYYPVFCADKYPEINPAPSDDVLKSAETIIVSTSDTNNKSKDSWRRGGINRQITDKEYKEAIDCMSEFGLENGWIQESPSEKDRNIFLGENF